MKSTIGAISILLMASLAGAQAAAPSTAKKTAAKPVANASKATAKPAAPAAKSATTAAAKKSTAAAKSATPAKVKPATPAAHAKAAPAKVIHHAKPAAAPVAVSAPVPAAPASRKRDPFVNPVQAVREGLSGACQGGKRCLAITEIVLRGVVKAPNGMIAVVENSAQRTYFLRENDAIFNGFVQKITPDSVTFREHYTDNLGRDAQRDITKTVNAPVV